MARPQGSRNQNYDQERARLSSMIMERLTQPDGPSASLRALATHCQVSPPTLRHYFEDRDGAVIAAFEHAMAGGEPHLGVVREAELGPAPVALTSLLRFTVLGWERFGVGDIFRAGLEIGLGHERLGPAYINSLLEPLLQAFEQRLRVHQSRQELRPELDPSTGALMLLSPILLGLLHQVELGGRTCRALDLDALICTQVDAFMRAWGAP